MSQNKEYVVNQIKPRNTMQLQQDQHLYQNMTTGGWMGTPLICSFRSGVDYNRTFHTKNRNIYADNFCSNNIYTDTNNMRQFNIMGNTSNSHGTMAHLIIHAHGIPLISNQSGRNSLRHNKNGKNPKWNNTFTDRKKYQKIINVEKCRENGKSGSGYHRNEDFINNNYENIYNKNVDDEMLLISSNKSKQGNNRSFQTPSRNPKETENTRDDLQSTVGVDEQTMDPRLPRIIKPRRRRKRDKKMSYDSSTTQLSSDPSRLLLPLAEESINIGKLENCVNSGVSVSSADADHGKLENFTADFCNSSGNLNYNVDGGDESSLANVTQLSLESFHHNHHEISSLDLKDAYKDSHADKKSTSTTCCCCLCDPFCKIWSFPLHHSSWNGDAAADADDFALQQSLANINYQDTLSQCSCLSEDDLNESTSTSSSILSHIFQFRNPAGPISFEVLNELDMFRNKTIENNRNYVACSGNGNIDDCMSSTTTICSDLNNNNINTSIVSGGTNEIRSDYNRKDGFNYNSLAQHFPTAELLLSESINELSEKLMEVLDTRADVQTHS